MLTGVIVLLLLLLAILLISALAAYAVYRRQCALRHPGATDTANGLRVPVKALFVHSGGILGMKHRNSITPKLMLASDGIRYRAVGSGLWPFDTIAHVEAHQRRGAWRLIFVGRSNGAALIADILEEQNVQATLRALPDDMALTPQAALLRNGSCRGGRSDLLLYRGPTR